MDQDPPPSPPQPAIWRWFLGFLLVGACWGLTTPFMRRAAVNYTPSSRPELSDPKKSWIWRKLLGVFWAVVDLLRRPSYAIPLLLNITGSVWFFLLIGQAGTRISGAHYVMRADDGVELSLTVPITNSLAFLFTVLGEWYAEGKVISRDTWLGMGLVLGGIGLCVHAKTS